MREKGYKRSPEEIEKAKQTRIRNKQLKETPVSSDPPILKIPCNLETGFDYWPYIRNVLRSRGEFLLCKKVERELVNPMWWQNKDKIHEVLNKYFIVEITDEKKRKKHEYTEAERIKIGERLQKAREKRRTT